ncbi:hypothetical protein SDC9_168678 [bioreactor metagenome]|uniref:Uncharacterized protein n=1 Tax=bioreactor metagenome TaxID=1076179 RepID=A0A645G667_9ZZZZ
MDDRAIGDGGFGSFGVGAALIIFTYRDATGKHCVLAHVIRFQDLKPLIRQAAAHSAYDCLNNTHDR